MVCAGAAVAQVPQVEPPVYPPVEPVIVPDGPGALKPFYGLSLDGGDNANATDAATANEFDWGTGDFSVSVWLKPTGASIDGVMNKRVTVGWQWTLQPAASNGGIFRQNDGGNVDISPDTDVTGTMYDGAWHHHLITVERGAVDEGKWYLDGVLVADDDISALTGSTDNTDVMYIGTWGAGTSPYAGTMTDLRFFSTVLTQAQATAEAANKNPYIYPTVAPFWQGILADGPGATQITPVLGSTAFTYGAGAAAPTPTTATSTKLPPNGF